jgi:hypothetical protein
MVKLVGPDLISSRCGALDDIGEPDTSRDSRVVLEPVPDGLEDSRLDQALEQTLPLPTLVVVPDGHTGRCRVDADADSPRMRGKQVGKGLHLGSHPIDDHSVTGHARIVARGDAVSRRQSRSAVAGLPTGVPGHPTSAGPHWDGAS